MWRSPTTASRSLVHYVFAVLAVSVWFAVACGSPTQDTSVRAEAPDSPSDVDLAPTLPETPPSVPPIKPLESQLENTNIRDGGVGSLCWARWEVSRYLVRASVQEESPTGREEASRSIVELREQLPVVATELDRAMSQVPIEVRPFLEEFKDRVATAQQSPSAVGDVEGELRELGKQFDFESYPGAVEYDERSRAHPGCLRP